MRRFLPAIAFLVVWVASNASQAVPRYSARYRQNCTLCHQNPAGGGGLKPAGQKFKANGNKL